MLGVVLAVTPSIDRDLPPKRPRNKVRGGWAKPPRRAVLAITPSIVRDLPPIRPPIPPQ